MAAASAAASAATAYLASRPRAADAVNGSGTLEISYIIENCWRSASQFQYSIISFNDLWSRYKPERFMERHMRA